MVLNVGFFDRCCYQARLGVGIPVHLRMFESMLSLGDLFMHQAVKLCQVFLAYPILVYVFTFLSFLFGFLVQFLLLAFDFFLNLLLKKLRKVSWLDQLLDGSL